MNLREARRYRQVTHKRPSEPILAFGEPHEVNEVVLYDGCWRLRIVEELTREEFMRRLAHHLACPDAVAGASTLVGQKVDIDSSVDIKEPGPEFLFFYAANLV